MCGFYCIAFIEYMIAGKTLLDYTNLFSSNYYKKNGMLIYKYFKDKYDKNDVSIEFTQKYVDETKKYLVEEIKHNELISKKHKKT